MASRHSSFFRQNRWGTPGNFEVLAPRTGGGMVHWWRDNADPVLPWVGPTLASGSADDVSAVSLIQGNFGEIGNLEAVALEGSRLVHHWRDDGGSGRWQARTYLPSQLPVVGNPALLQSSHGGRGSYELVAPLATGGLGHWWRDNDQAGLPWIGPTVFGTGTFDAVAMLQGPFGAAGNLELVARAGDQLWHFWRDDGASWSWHGPILVASGVAGIPCVLQSSSGGVGNYELVCPLAAGGLGHWWRDNDQAGLPWIGPTVFGTGNVSAAGLVQGSFGGAGNLELVAMVGAHQLAHYWRDGGSGGWYGPFQFADEDVGDPTSLGQCTIPFRPPIVAVHAGLAHTGRLALFAFADADALVGVSLVLDPTTGAATAPPESHHLFCSGHAFLPDGTLLCAGGHHHDITAIHTFDPATETWEHVAEMENGRWYPTCTALPGGQVLVVSGTKGNGGPVSPTSPVNNTLQLYDPAAGLQPEQPLPAPFSDFFPPDFPTIDLYPFVYALPDGQLCVHSRNTTRFYDPVSETWSPVQLPAAHPHSRTYPGQGSSVLLSLSPTDAPPYRARLLTLGGGGADPAQLTGSTPATATAEILDLGELEPAWRLTAPMHRARVMHDATLLPDGTVLVAGGSATGRADHGLDPVLELELFDPATETWTLLCPMRVPRSYHSVALLLPDARVLIAGKDGLFNPAPYDYPEHRCEVVSPPYLFRGPRPVIASAPAAAGFGAAFVVRSPQAASIASAAFLRPGCVTHSFNMEQRRIGLSLLGRTGTSLRLRAPPNAQVAPPGYYMLFLIDQAGVPSAAAFVRLG